jgi:hypothetical protein
VKHLLVFTKQAQKVARVTRAGGTQTEGGNHLGDSVGRSIPEPAPFEKPIGDLAGAYSRRINIQHRLVYQVLAEERVV